MHLILGSSLDPCCSGVEARLIARGLAVRLMAMPLSPPARLALRIEPDGRPVRPAAALVIGGGPGGEIDSVLVRATGGLDPAGWDPIDHAYMQAEAQAALLAWLAALDRPVVNRPTAELWYRSRSPLLAWAPLLRRFGLPAPETLLSSDPDAARDFARRLEAGRVPGAVCASLTQDGEWLVGPDEWAGVVALQAHAPVCLTEPHSAVHSVCVIGGELVWDTAPEPAEATLGPSLRGFAAAAGLNFLEFAVGRVRRGPAVVHVDPMPRLEHFEEQARSRILDALTALLAGPAVAVTELAEAPA
jgi:hypothetical protein